MYIIRQRLKLSPEKAIFFFVKGHIPATSCMLSFIYDDYKDNDNFLYITYLFENTFGLG